MTQSKENQTTALGKTYVWARPGHPPVRGKVVEATDTYLVFEWEKAGLKASHKRPLGPFFFEEEK